VQCVNPIGLLILTGGVIVGALMAAAIRHLVYVNSGWEPNVHPGMGYITFPLLALPLAVCALLLHVALRRFFAYVHAWQWLLAGIAYGLWFVAFLEPSFLVLALLLNPLTFQCALIVRTRISDH